MITKLLLFLSLTFCLEVEAGDPWSDPWVTPENASLFTFTQDGRTGSLSIPEYHITKENVLVARLNLQEDEFTNINIVCKSDYCNSFTPPDYGLVSVDTQTKEIRSTDLRLNYEDENQANTIEIQVLVNETNWANCFLSQENYCKSLTINLVNINDVRPKFTAPSEQGLTLSVTEKEDNSSLYTIQGLDDEFFEPLSLSISNPDQNRPFSLTKTGPSENGVTRWDLGVSGLNYDTGPKTYYLDLELTDTPDRFGESQVTSSRIIITVDDVPDQFPVWVEQCYPKTIYENITVGETLYTIQAQDMDYGINSNITYRILDNSTMASKFRLEPDETNWKRQKVILSEKINIEDEELQNSPIINIYIEAEEEVACSDLVCYRSITSCMLLLRDNNDNSPAFNSKTFSADVKENVKIGEILPFMSGDQRPRVQDDDLTFNKISIAFQNETMADFFNVNPSSVVVSADITISSSVQEISLLDADTGRTTLDLVVVARDEDKPEEFVDTAIFTINIIDVNDMVPYFSQDQYNVSVKEDLSNLDESKVLVKVSAKDDDISPEYGTPSLRYKFVPGSELKGLVLDPLSGVITVEDPDTFDYEQEVEHSLQIEARDCGDAEVCDPQSRYTRATLLIKVENVNDNPPELSSPDQCQAEIFNTIMSNPVLSLRASDGDVSDSVKFSLLDDQDSPFSVENLSNSEAAINVDRSRLVEVEETHEMVLQLTDTGSPPLITNVSCRMIIKDVNDKDPEFVLPEPETKYWIRDDLPPLQPMTLYNGSPLRLEATDEDANSCYNTVKYSFRSNLQTNYREFFSVNQDSGVLTLLKDINGSRWEDEDGIPNLITLPVEAEDNSGPDCQGDINNVPAVLYLKVFTNFEPEFGQTVQNWNVNETVMEEDLIALLPSNTFQAAVDGNNESPPPDPAWVNQTICYYILQPRESPFELDKETNTVRVVEPLDVDNCVDCNQYQLTIGASNNCNEKPPEEMFAESSKMTANILVDDINDNSPFFSNIRSYYVYSTVEAECKDCDISAQDDDIVLDTKLHFKILSQNASDGSTARPFNFTDDPKSITIFASSLPPPEDQRYYDLVLEVRDNLDHSTNATIKIVVMTDLNNVTFGFDSSRDEIDRNKEEIIQILDTEFNWSFSSKGIKDSVTFSLTTDTEVTFTTLEGYFVDPEDNFRPKSQNDIATKYDLIFDNLNNALKEKLNISLDYTKGFRGETTDNWQNPDSTAGIIVGSVTAGLVVVTGLFLLTAYCMRTRALERRVKAMDTLAVDTATEEKTGKPWAPATVQDIPGSNEFAESGENPIWQAAMENTEYEENELQFMDDVSEYSGDSILIGVEDQTEFNDYKEKVEEAEVDMELYNKMWGKVKRLDDYHVEQKSEEREEVFF